MLLRTAAVTRNSAEAKQAKAWKVPKDLKAGGSNFAGDFAKSMKEARPALAFPLPCPWSALHCPAPPLPATAPAPQDVLACDACCLPLVPALRAAAHLRQVLPHRPR